MTARPVEDAAWLCAALVPHGLTLPPEDAPAALATAQFLADAARRVREAANEQGL